MKRREPTISKQELSHVAQELENQLKALAPTNSAASSVLHRFSQIIEEAIQGKIESPYKYQFFPEEFWEDGELSNVKPLSETASRFNILLRGISIG
jgi:hypothetical protein